MGGGELILNQRSTADVIYVNNPQISFYRNVFKRYSRFAVETKTIEINRGDSLQVKDTTTVTVNIPTNDGHLLKSMYLHVELPDIYSGIMHNIKGTGLSQEFHWIKELGRYLIKRAKLKINGNVIQDLHDEYQDVWKELNLTKEEKKQHDIMTGNTTDMYAPEFSNGYESSSSLALQPFLNPCFLASNDSGDMYGLLTHFENSFSIMKPNTENPYRYDVITKDTSTHTTILQLLFSPILPNTSVAIDSFKFFNTSYTTLYANTGNITFDAADTTQINTLSDHFSKKRITAFGGPSYTRIFKYINFSDKEAQIAYFHKDYFVPFIYNFSDDTFERADGNNHGLLVDDIVIFKTISNEISDLNNSIYNIVSATGLTAKKFKLKDSLSNLYITSSSGWQIGAISFLYNPENGYWRRGDGIVHGYSNGNTVSFSSSGGGQTDIFDGVTTYYIINKTDTEFQLSLSENGTALISNDQITLYEYSTDFKYITGTHTWQRVDGLPHGFSENDGISFKRINSELPNFYNSADPYNGQHFITKNVTSTTFQIFEVYDNPTGLFLSTPRLVSDNVSSTETFTVIIFSPQIMLFGNDHATKANHIELLDYNTDDLVIPDTKLEYRVSYPIGISGITTGDVPTNFNNVRIFNFYNETNTNQTINIKAITNYYPHSKKLKIEAKGAPRSLYDYELNKQSGQRHINCIVDNSKNDITPETIPSIEGRILKIPLYFFFQKDISKALPLIALNKSIIQVELELRPLVDLYTARYTEDLSTGSYANLPRNIQDTFSNYLKFGNDEYSSIIGMEYFLGNDEQTQITISNADNTKKLNVFKINSRLEYSVIYLDDIIKKKFENIPLLQYYIDDISKQEESEIVGQSSSSFIVNSAKPLKQLIIVPKRTDSKDINEWTNFTNWTLEGKNTAGRLYSDTGGIKPTYTFTKEHEFFNTAEGRFTFPNNRSQSLSYRTELLQKDIITDIEIKDDNKNISVQKDSSFYQKQQIQEYYKKRVRDGIYVYNFSLDPKKSFSTGELFTSKLNININYTGHPDSSLFKSDLVGTFNEKQMVSAYSFNVNIYKVEYNILEISNKYDKSSNTTVQTAGLLF